ncbi:MAG: transcription termination factor Rho, partial [Firmicutes bacterium]|nr:transcription termination factor Rho [Bacillota bacterium]
MELDIIKGKKVAELREIAAALGIEGASGMKKAEIIAILTTMHEQAVAEGAVKEEPEEPAEKEAPKKAKGRKPGRKPKAEAAEEKPEEKTQESEPAAETKEPAEPCEERSAEGEEPAQGQQKQEQKKDGRTEKSGILEIADGGFGFLRFNNFLTSDEDVYVSPMLIRRFNLKTGDELRGIVRPPGEGERFGAMLYVNTVNGDDPGVAIRRKDFSELTPIYPEKRIRLERGSSTLSMRLIDLVAPIGLGQRGLIVAPPKAGKTTLLKQMAKAIEAQDIDVELIVLLIDERPEEVTDMQRSINGQVIYSTFDELPAHHVKVAEMVLARAQRLCEHGKNVIILMDSITRLARAYNLVE